MGTLKKRSTTTFSRIPLQHIGEVEAKRKRARKVNAISRTISRRLVNGKYDPFNKGVIALAKLAAMAKGEA